jgi:hypothetical protein
MAVYEYLTTCSGYEDDWGAEPWVNPEYVFDEDTANSGTNFVYSEPGSPGPPTYPYWWNWTFSNSLWVSTVNNVTSSGTILGVYIQVYGNREQDDYGDAYLELLPYVDGDILWYHTETMLPTVSGGEMTSVDITPAKESWSWSDIDGLEVDIYLGGAAWVDRLDFWVSQIKCLIVAEDE